MQHIWSILCKNSSVDSTTNLLSIFDCIEEINLAFKKGGDIKKNFVAPITLQLVSFWLIDKEEKLDLEVELLDPKDRVLHKFKSSFGFKKGIKRFRSRINIEGLHISQQGRYKIRISAKNKGTQKYELVSELPLDIVISYTLKLPKG